ncbi:MAG: GSCFA domain-containing protein [Alistipes sp.]|nr:GSCFA domain-containing protein [Alistipes sp.]
MDFRTTIPIRPLARKLDHSQTIFLIGSCFTENIAKRLSAAKFRVTASPTGILFNPESIADAIGRCALRNYPTREELQYGNERWFSYDFHSSFSNADADTALAAMREGIDEGFAALNSADTFIITFGTAIAYRHTKSERVVANCHKQSQAMFRREMLSVEDIVVRYSALLDSVLRNKQVIFTVSPIRHLGEGLEQNSLSKATLRVAIGEIMRHHDNASYFPSFEIMNDDLRDYRFYAEDMVHPSALAIDYIWKCFSEAAFLPATQSLIERIEAISKAMAHRPFNPQSEAYRRFCQQQLEEIEKIRLTCPKADFRKEDEFFAQYL